MHSLNMQPVNHIASVHRIQRGI